MDSQFRTLFKELFKDDDDRNKPEPEYESEYEQVQIYLFSYFCDQHLEKFDDDIVCKILLEGEKKFLPTYDSSYNGYGTWNDFFMIDHPFKYSDWIIQGPVADELYPHEISLNDYTNLYKYIKMIIINFPCKITPEMKSTILNKINEVLKIFESGEASAGNILGTEKIEKDYSKYIDIFKKMKELIINH